MGKALICAEKPSQAKALAASFPNENMKNHTNVILHFYSTNTQDQYSNFVADSFFPVSHRLVIFVWVRETFS